ncbi:endolytic transglycosylase MltG [Clostridium lundense]|uniref:endolytic transglycosylase MltG n=1 Tax=Clostridium lundense TaxID=319475 RepID=UPI00146FC1F4|nr:endolytic transglycosylase MltG [Clostridium lundense]
MRKVKRILTSFLILLVMIVGIYSYYRSVVNHPFKDKGKDIGVIVNNGDSLYKVLNSLDNKKEIKNLILIKTYIKRNNLNTTIKPGNYQISSDVTLKELMIDLNKGIFNKNLVKVTIPEGYDIEKIALLLEEKDIIKKEEFLQSCREFPLPRYIKNVGNRKYNLEGYLFPDTYELVKGMQGKDIIDIMYNRFNRSINELRNKYSIDDNKIDTIITMASMVEREAERDEERGKVASVFYNRINIGMKMESCATVLYALGKHKNKLYYSDLKIKSPYNTYIIKGFPPGPICSPGISSIKAAINPDKTNYLYFVSYNNGTHFFTRDYKEFLKVKKQTQGN